MNEQRYAVAAAAIFDGALVRDDYVVIVEGASIAALVRRRDMPAGLTVHELPHGAWLAPGFIDVQVNGGGDALFNNEPTPEGIAKIAAAHRRFGTTGILPTLITDSDDKMRAARAAADAARQTLPGVLGIHFEGPFLSPEKCGVHDPSLMRAPNPSHRDVFNGHPGVTLVTLAPERVPDGFIRSLAGAGVRVSLGHSMATYEQTRIAIADGLTGFTHLFNAMRPLAAREPGPIAAALESPGCWYGLIIDGIHVAPPMLRLALKGAGAPMLVTDAMPNVGGVKKSFTLYGSEIIVEGQRVTMKDGTLAGSGIDMASAVRNCVKLLGVPLADALRFASRAPAEFLGVGNRYGRIAPGYRADMVALDPSDIRVLGTYLSGAYESS
ncbi:MAG: N-acetylglucosamine-6-phosphate deacetylase [Alphaproteobacteria bacterium]|jgi:N-acetylglucosamine-6-phosphate deacetylase|nr:N-acetylglucosamine-6-phosphate deacetylase [Alphaproteobacteria bacterium]